MLILCTEQWAGLGLALLAQRQGSDVLCATNYAKVPKADHAANALIGDGLISKMPLTDAVERLRGQGHLWVFDANDFGAIADGLRDQGEAVIGTSVLSQKLEDDRSRAAEFAQSLGFRLPLSKDFTNDHEALRFLEANAAMGFCYKPDAQDPTATYVPLKQDDPEEANAELREYIGSLKRTGKAAFQLQQIVQGTEVNFDLWMSQGQPLMAFCDLEAKRKLVGDLGENVGCAGDYVFPVPLECDGVRETVGRYLQAGPLQRYTGTADANVMVVNGEPYFLENCFRFGYNAYASVFQGLDLPVEAVLRAWVAGDPTLPSAFPEGLAAASLSLVVDHPKRGSPIVAQPSVLDRLYLYRAKQDGGLAIVEGWPEVACVVAASPDLWNAGQQCLALAGEVGIPDKGYRTDLTETNKPTLPLARYEQLTALGWIPDLYDDRLTALAVA